MWRTRGKGHSDTQPSWPSGTQRIVEWFGMKRTFKDYLVSTMLPWAGTPSIATRLLKASSSLALNSSRDETATVSGGSLFQCVTTPVIKKFSSYLQYEPALFQFKTVAFCTITTGPCKSLFPSFFFSLS